MDPQPVTVLEALDLGNDVLLVRATVAGLTERVAVPRADRRGRPVRDRSGVQLVEVAEQPRVLEARGWLSAMEHHYDPDAYDEAGNLKEGAEPRAMSGAERLAYCKRLIAEQHPAAAAAGRSLGIAG